MTTILDLPMIRIHFTPKVLMAKKWINHRRHLIMNTQSGSQQKIAMIFCVINNLDMFNSSSKMS